MIALEKSCQVHFVRRAEREHLRIPHGRAATRVRRMREGVHQDMGRCRVVKQPVVTEICNHIPLSRCQFRLHNVPSIGQPPRPVPSLYGSTQFVCSKWLPTMARRADATATPIVDLHCRTCNTPFPCTYTMVDGQHLCGEHSALETDDMPSPVASR